MSRVLCAQVLGLSIFLLTLLLGLPACLAGAVNRQP